MSSPQTVPTPRVLLTSLFNSLSHPASHPHIESGLDLPITTTNTTTSTTTTSNTNPLKALPTSHRSLLITLHVLFPSLLLQALDLLERGLVTRATQAIPSAPSEAPPHPHAQPPEKLKRQEKQQTQENSLYFVHSAQSARSRSSATSSARYGTTQGTTYTVRLQAWNCSCAAFAFSAFPASASGSFAARLDDDGVAVESDEDWVSEVWEFGGMSRDGKGLHGGGEAVPCCKHLLACVLADRWEDVLGSYVKQVRVGREEMAGLGADGSL